MNRAVRHMFRNRRQAEGRRPQEPQLPPRQLRNQWEPERNFWESTVPTHADDWTADIYPGFSYVANEEHEQRTNLYLPPAFETNALEELATAHQYTAESLDNSDPINSNFYAAGNKIRPWAHNRVANAGYLAMSEWLGGANDEFMSGKISALGHVVPQQVGGQTTIDTQPLIPEAEYTTYGAMTALAPTDQFAEEDGYLYA